MAHNLNPGDPNILWMQPTKPRVHYATGPHGPRHHSSQSLQYLGDHSEGSA